MSAGIIGVLWALVAMVSWGCGDFYIQKVSRSIGIWKNFFFISIIGTLGLFPFVLEDLHKLTNLKNLLFLGISAIAMSISSVLDFEALKEGKLAVMEPILSMELPLAVIFSVILLGESAPANGWLLVIAIFIGNSMSSASHLSHLHYHRRIFEKGVIYALAAATSMALVDILMGASSRETSPLLTVWAVWLFTSMVSFWYLFYRGKLKELRADFLYHPSAILSVGIFDTMGWVGFCLATPRIPISIATAIGQSYIVITVLLGLFTNHEHVQVYQKWGITVAIISVISLAAITG